MQLVFMFSSYQLNPWMPYVHCLLLIFSSSRSQGSGSEGFDLKGSSTDLNSHCSDLVYWKYMNSVNLLWNQWLRMGPVRRSSPDYNTELQALSSFWVLWVPQRGDRRDGGTQWVLWDRSERATCTEWGRHSWSGPGLTTAWFQHLWHCK